MRHVHRWTRFCVERRLLDTADHANHLALFLFKTNAHTLADRFLSGPDTFSERVVDDDHGRSVSLVLRVELPALQKRDLKRRKIIRRDHRVISIRSFAIGRRFLPLQEHVRPLVCAGQRQRQNTSSILDTRQRLKPSHYLLEERSLLFVSFVSRRWQVW